MSDIWRLFPYPTMAGDELTPGSVVDVHRDCSACKTRDCVADDQTPENEVRVCRYGLTYCRIDGERTVVGVVATDLPNPTPKSKRRIRLERERLVGCTSLRRTVEQARALGPGVVNTFESDRAEALKAIHLDPEMQRIVGAQLRSDAEEDLNQSHDFMQMVKLVKGYSEALLGERFPGVTPEEAAELAHNEGAIYFATQLMIFKMDSLRYVNEMNRAVGAQNTFGIHPLVLKYKRIYDWQAQQKKLRIHLGSSHRQARYNGDAIGTLVQALLDNMVKYSPPRSEASINFIETSESVVLEFASLGPKIETNELASIFMTKFRSKAARREENSGQGIGLAAAKQISDALGLNLSGEQESDAQAGFPGRYWTTFRFRLSVRS